MAATKEKDDAVAALWEAALDNYIDITEVDIRSLLSTRKSISTIIMEQQCQLDAFREFRHNKGKLDRLRSTLSSNSDFLQDAATQISNAASIAFPPSSVILASFTWVLTASTQVSEDYSLIEGFFKLMESFLRRLCLLEGKIPPSKEFQLDLIRVFSSILTISALARKYRHKGRLKAWGEALVKGKDPKLKDAYDTLHENLRNLESAVMLQTLKTAMDTHDETMSISQGIISIQEKLDKNTGILETNTTIAFETQDVVLRTNTGVTELVKRSHENEHMNREIIRVLKRYAKEGDKEHQLQTRAGRPTNFARLKALLQVDEVPEYMQQRQRDFEYATAPHVLEWIEKEPGLQDVVNSTESLFWVTGGSGMGKSTAAFRIFQYLKETFSDESSTSVVWFAFDQEHPDMRSVSLMLMWCSLKAAETDPEYCEEVLRDLHDRPLASYYMLSAIKERWRRLLETKFSPKSNRRLVIVLDGIDEASEHGLPELLKLLVKVTNADCKIQLILTSDSSHDAVTEALSNAGTKRVDLTRERIAKDLRHFAWSLARTMPRFRKLRTKFRSSVVRKVANKADSLIYVGHVMRRLNLIGYESSVRKEIGRLPADTNSLYETLLNDCMRNRSSEDREVIRNLLVWVAYSKSKISLGEANLLVNIIREEHSINIDEAMEGPLSRLLRISGNAGRDGRDSDSEVDAEDSKTDLADSEEDSEEAAARKAEEETIFLQFQERSLRAYFREAINDPRGLRCSPAEAHVIIFTLCAAILMQENDLDPDGILRRPEDCEDKAEAELICYAAIYILAHFMEIDVESVNDESAKSILECLFSMFSVNRNKCLRYLEVAAAEDSGDESTVLCGRDVDEEAVLERLGVWSKRATSLPSGHVAEEQLEWFRRLAEDPRGVFITLARGHVHNWFSAPTGTTARDAFLRAHTALLRGRSQPEFRENQELQEYFEQFEEDDSLIAKSYEVVSNAFQDIEKTATAYACIAGVMRHSALYSEVIVQVDLGLKLEPISDDERRGLLREKGNALFSLGRDSEGEESENYLNESIATLDLALGICCKTIEASGLTSNLRLVMPHIFMIQTIAATRLKKSDLIVEKLKEAVKLGLNFYHNPQRLAGVILSLFASGEYKKGMEVLRTLPKEDLAVLIGRTNEDMHDEFRKGAKSCGEEKCLLELYGVAAKAAAVNRQPHTTSFLQFQAACFASDVMGDAGEAKVLLREIVHDVQAPLTYVEQACYKLAGLLLEDFRSSGDPMVKNAALQEAKSLQERLAEVLGTDFKTADSPISVTLAHMLRKLGPALELADVLQASFQSCVDLLSDEIGYNDYDSLRLLAVVLSCVQGLEYEAQVAYTAQFYVLDKDIRTKELNSSRSRQRLEDSSNSSDESAEESEEESEKDREFPAEKEDEEKPDEESKHPVKNEDEKSPKPEEESEIESSAKKENEEKPDEEIESPAKKENEEKPDELSKNPVRNEDEKPEEETKDLPKKEDEDSAKNPEETSKKDSEGEEDSDKSESESADESDDDPMEEGLRDDHRFRCSACRDVIADWSGGGAYICIQCIGCNICEDCFEQRLSREKGELDADWRVVCPQGHSHIKAPVVGWKGVKDGKLRIGEEEIPFKEWLDVLQNKWKSYWEQFWLEKVDLS